MIVIKRVALSLAIPSWVLAMVSATTGKKRRVSA